MVRTALCGHIQWISFALTCKVSNSKDFLLIPGVVPEANYIPGCYDMLKRDKRWLGRRIREFAHGMSPPCSLTSFNWCKPWSLLAANLFGDSRISGSTLHIRAPCSLVNNVTGASLFLNDANKQWRRSAGRLHNWAHRKLMCTFDNAISSNSENFFEHDSQEHTIICFDLETTGNHENSRITEVAMRDMAGGEFSTMQTLVNPETHIPARITDLTGINSDMVRDCPTWSEVVHVVQNFVEHRRKDRPVILVAHNGHRFDTPFLAKEFMWCGLTLPSHWRFADSLEIAQLLKKTLPEDEQPENYKLEFLHTHYFGLPQRESAHRALADVGMLARIFPLLLTKTKITAADFVQKVRTADYFTERRKERMAKIRLLGSGEAVNGQRILHLNAIQKGVQNLELSHRGNNSQAAERPSNEIDGLAEEEEYAEEMTNLVVMTDIVGIRDEEQENWINNDDLDDGLQLQDHAMQLQEGQIAEELPTHNSIISKDGPTDILCRPYLREFQGYFSRDLNNKHLKCVPSQDSIDLISIQYRVETKDGDHPEDIFLFKHGNSHKAYFEDALKVAKAAGERTSLLPVSSIGQVSTVSIAEWQLEGVIRVLLQQGRSISLQSLDDLGKWVISERYEPGVILDKRFLPPDSQNYIAALWARCDAGDAARSLGAYHWGLAYADVSTGEVQSTAAMGEASLREELLRLWPATLVYPLQAGNKSQSKGGRDSNRLRGVPEGIHCIPISDAALQSSFQGGMVQAPEGPSDVLEGSSEQLYDDLFGVDMEQDKGALVVLRAYLQQAMEGVVHRSIIPGWKDGTTYSDEDYLRMTDNTRKFLMVEGQACKSGESLLAAMDATCTPMGTRTMRHWLLWPLRSLAAIQRRHKIVAALVEDSILRSSIRASLRQVTDLERLLVRLQLEIANARELREMATSLRHAFGVENQLLGLRDCSPDLASMGLLQDIPLGAVIAVDNAIKFFGETEIGGEHGELKSASEDAELQRLWHLVEQSSEKLKNHVAEVQGLLGISTIRVAGNFLEGHCLIVPEGQLNFEALGPGYSLQDKASSDEKCLITAQLALYDRLTRHALDSIQQRELVIARELGQQLAEHSLELLRLARGIARLDVLVAFAEVAAERNYVQPDLSSERKHLVKHGRHPLLELRLTEATPNSTMMTYDFQCPEARENEFSSNLALGRSDGNGPPRSWLGLWKEGQAQSSQVEAGSDCGHESSFRGSEQAVLLIQGPRGSGRSSFLQQVGMVQLLAQAGSFVPADEACLGIVDAILTVANSAIDADLARALAAASPNSLVLIDCPSGWGEGTHSQEGFAQSLALAEYLTLHSKALGVVAAPLATCQDGGAVLFGGAARRVAPFHFGHADEDAAGPTKASAYLLRPGIGSYSPKDELHPSWISRRSGEILAGMSTETWSGSVTGMCHHQAQGGTAEESLEAQSRMTSSPEYSGKPQGPDNPDSVNASQEPQTETSLTAEEEEEEKLFGKSRKEVWTEVLGVLGGKPLTYALACQQGSLMRLTVEVEADLVLAIIGAPNIKVASIFKKENHSRTLQAAFETVLDRSVQLQVVPYS